MLLISGAGTTLLLLASFAGFWVSWHSFQSFSDEVELHRLDERLTLQLQIEFKKQIQEWKDVLIRGYEAEALDKYWKNFETQERKVQETGNYLLENLRDEPQSLALVRQFISAHKDMGTSYRNGLQVFKENHFDSHAADKMIKGIDRPAAELLNQAAEKIAVIAQQSSRNEVESGRRGILVSLGFMGLAVVLAFFIRPKQN